MLYMQIILFCFGVVFPCLSVVVLDRINVYEIIQRVSLLEPKSLRAGEYIPGV